MARTHHYLKTLPVFFEPVARGDKTFEVRRDDRQFQKGDILRLLEFDPTDQSDPPTHYTRREIEFEVTYVLRGGQFGIEPGFVVLGLGPSIPDCSAP